MADDKPKALKTLHKVLIGSGIGLGVLFTIFSAARQSYVAAGSTAVVTVLLSLYLRWFVRKR